MGEVNIVEGRGTKYEPGLLIMSRDESVQEIYFVDSYGDYYDEITGRKLIREEVISARLDPFPPNIFLSEAFPSAFPSPKKYIFFMIY